MIFLIHQVMLLAKQNRKKYTNENNTHNTTYNFGFGTFIITDSKTTEERKDMSDPFVSQTENIDFAEG